MRAIEYSKVEIHKQDSSVSSSSEKVCNLKKLCLQFLDKVVDQAHVETLLSLPVTWKYTKHLYEFI